MPRPTGSKSSSIISLRRVENPRKSSIPGPSPMIRHKRRLMSLATLSLRCPRDKTCRRFPPPESLDPHRPSKLRFWTSQRRLIAAFFHPRAQDRRAKKFWFWTSMKLWCTHLSNRLPSPASSFRWKLMANASKSTFWLGQELWTSSRRCKSTTKSSSTQQV